MRVEPRIEPRSRVRAAFNFFFVKHKEIFLTFFCIKHKEIFLNLDSLFFKVRGSMSRAHRVLTMRALSRAVRARRARIVSTLSRAVEYVRVFWHLAVSEKKVEPRT